MSNKDMYNNKEIWYYMTGDAGIAVEIGYEYEFGFNNRKKDIIMAIHWFNKAGDPESLERVKNLKKHLEEQ